MVRRCLGAAGWCAALLLIVVCTAAPAAAQTVIPLTITEVSSQFPGTPGSGSSLGCPNTTISISVSFSVPRQFGSIAEALTAGSQVFGTGVGTGQAENFHGAQCEPEHSSVGPETYNVWFTKNTLGIQGLPDNIGIAAVTSGSWNISPTAITYGGPYIQDFGGPQVGTISFSINGDIGVAGTDVRVDGVRAIQVVDQSDVPLVLGKSAIARISGHIDDVSKLTPTQALSFLVFLGNTTTAIATNVHTVAELNVDGDGDFTVDVGFTPNVVGPSVPLTVEIVPLTGESRIDNNWSAPLPVTVKATRGLYVAYIKMDGLFCGGTVDHYDDTFTQSAAYVSGVFPLAYPAPTSVRVGRLPVCAVVGATGAEAAFLIDYYQLRMLGWLYSGGLADRTVGVASGAYMDRLKTGLLGNTYCGGGAVVVRDGGWETVGHELGHSYELNHPGETKCLVPFSPVDGADGFWVDEGEPIHLPKAVGDARAATPALVSMMNAFPDGTFPVPKSWIAHDDYLALLKNQNFALNPQDPEILLVTGVLYRDGHVAWNPVYRLPEGLTDPSTDGEFALQVVDQSNRVISETSLDINFAQPNETGMTPDEWDAVPFGLRLAFPPTGATVQLTQNGRSIATFEIASTLLRDAVASLPDGEFTTNGPHRRKALLNKIDAFERGLTPQPTIGARQELLNDIRKRLADWLVDGYQVGSPLEYTKEQILGLVDELLQRISCCTRPCPRRPSGRRSR